jgi:signal transduction histidine kinase
LGTFFYRFIQSFTNSKKTMLVFCIAYLFISCKSNNNAASGPIDYFTAMRITDSLRNKRADSSSLRFIDSVYGTRTLTAKEQYEEYDLKRNFYYEGQHNYLMANLYADSMLIALKGKENEKPYFKDYGNAFQVKGDALLGLKRYDEAFQNYFKGKLLIAKIDDSNFNSGYSARLGMNYYGQGKFKDAAKYFIEAYRFRLLYTPKNKEEMRQQLAYKQELLDNTGLSFDKAGLPDSALLYFNKTLKAISDISALFSTLKDSVFTAMARGVVYGNMGDVYYKSGNIAKAESIWKQSIAINTQKGYENHDARLTQIKLIKLYLGAGMPNEARIVLQDLTATIKDEQDASTRLKWLKLEWEYHDKAKNVPQAYDYVQRYLKLKDSIENGSKSAASEDMGIAFKMLDQQHQNDLLKNDNTLKQLYLFTAILVAGAAFLIALLVGRNWRRQKKSVAVLTGLNKQVREHNKHIQHVLADLEQSHEENSRMMKVVAHDLRNPVGNITTIAIMLLEQLQLTDEHRELLEILQTSASDSLELINSLLHANALQENMVKELLDIHSLLNYCVVLMKFKASEKDQTIVFQSVHYKLMLNREKMWRVISNLLANAIKFSPEGSTIEISAHEKERSILIAVKDTGIGIPDDLKDKIFDMFTLAKRKGTAGEEPYGMGLAIAKQIVEAHDGTIYFESNRGGGTTFYVELPKVS